MQKTTAIITILASMLIVGVAVFGGAYWSAQKQISSLNTQVTELKDQVGTLQEENHTLKDEKAQLQTELNNTEEEKETIEQENESLTQQKSQIEQENTQLEQENCDGVWQNGTCVRKLEVIDPNGGERLCAGETAMLKWSAQGVDRVSLQFIEEGPYSTSYYYVGDVSSAEMENANGVSVYPWTVGEVESDTWPLQEGGSYKFKVVSNSSARYQDNSDTSLAIENCSA